MQSDESDLIDLALQQHILTKKQASLIREEMTMFPGQKAGRLMLNRHFVTEAQLAGLRSLAADAPAEAAAPPCAPEIPPVAASQPAPPPPPPAAPASSAPSAPAPVAPQAPLAQGSAPLSAAPPQPSPPPPAPPPPPPHAAPARPSAPPTEPGRARKKERPAARALEGDDDEPIGSDPPVALQPGGGELPETLYDFLTAARQWGCSDLHIAPERPVFMRHHTQINYLDMEPLTPEVTERILFAALTERQKRVVLDRLQLDFALEIPEIGRHRCNIYRQRLGWEGAFRIVPDRAPTFADIGLPATLQALTEYHQGLIVVTGPSGSGKTTTVAAMLDHINSARQDHIITVEDPVEYVLRSKNCQVTQREVGLHTKSFGAALRAALREDPDIILVGEMRDLETISIAISAAETGHLVFGTLHTTSAARTVARILDVYPPQQRAQICTMVAESMRGVVAQQLIPKKTGEGMALALEILIFTSGVAQQIKEGKTHQLASLMQSGKKIGMKLMDDSLMELFRGGQITGREAWLRSENKPVFEAVKEQ